MGIESTKRVLTLVAAIAILATAAPAGAVITGGGCVDDVSGESNNCTANDVTFVVVGLGVQDDGCVSTTDTVSIFLEGRIRNTTAQTRYDIGLYIATDGDPNGDGGHTGTCAREILTPAGTQGVTTCGPTALDLLRQYPLLSPDNGPYLNVDGDTCADLFAQGNSGCDQDTDGLWDDTVIRFDQALTFPCDDADANGLVEIPTCATWGNQNNQVGGVTCDGAVEAVPGTKAKCRCETVNSTIPVPQLALACSAPTQTLQTNDTGTFSVTYTNASACTPDLLLPERERCGTASYVFYEVDYDESRGTVSNIQLVRQDGSLFSGGTVVHDSLNGLITWTPVSGGFGTSGIIGPGESVTLSYDYTYTSTEENVILSATTRTFWTNDSSELGNVSAAGVTEQATVFCTSTATATPVTLASASVLRRDGVPVLEWSTATETANLGFNVFARQGDGWVQVNDELIPSQGIDSTAPAAYSLELPGFEGERYMIEDVALDGTRTLHGPFRRTKRYGARPKVEAVDWAPLRRGADAPRGRATLAGRKGGSGAGSVDPGPVRLLVDEAGVQRVTYEDLAAAGFDFAGVPSTQLAVTLRGEPVPVWVAPAGGSFGPGSFLEFVGEDLDTLYTRTNVYLLQRNVHTAERIAEDRARTSSGEPIETAVVDLRIERDRQYSFGSAGDDPWYDTRMIAFAGRPKRWSFPVELTELAAGAGASSLTLELWGVTSWPEDGDHHALVWWNGERAGEATWDGMNSVRIEVELPEGVARAGTNDLTIELPADRGAAWDVVDVESYTVRYPRALVADADGLVFTAAGTSFRVQGPPGAGFAVYRVSPQGTERVTGVEEAADGTLTLPGLPGVAAQYHLTSAATAARPGIDAARTPAGLTEGQADYLVISHAAFLDGLGPLVALREAGGLSVRVVDVADVYDRYTDGVFDPAALQAYVADAVRDLGTRYVLLVGGDTFDYHDQLGLGSVSFIPSLYTPTGNGVRWAPSDPLMADVDGDRVPDVPIGRLPVRSRAELDAVIAKILTYEGKSYGRTALLAADSVDSVSRFSFTQASEAFARSLPAGWAVERAYLDSLGVSGARERLTNALADGMALTSFMGHSGLTHWTVSNLFGAADVASLDNEGAPTVVVQWGCWNTYHVEPRFHTLGHRFLLTEGKGAAAVLGSATLLQTSSADALGQRLTPLLVQPGMTLGDAVTAAKQDLASEHPERQDAILGWTLLGDPAMAVDR